MVESIEELYVKYEEAKSGLNSLLAERNLLENNLAELKTTLQVLDEFEKIKKGDEILSTIGSGIFVRTSIIDPTEIVVNVGAKILKKMSLEDAKVFVNERITSVENVMNEMDQKIAELANSLQMIEEKIQEKYKEKR